MSSLVKPKVSIVRCDGYEGTRLRSALRESLDLIGGLGAFVKRSSRVLIKPNLLSARIPDEAVDTHPGFVREVAALVKEAGGLPAIGDSPGSFFTIKSIDEVYEKSGIKRVADEIGAELVRFDRIVHIDGYPIAEVFDKYDLVINLPKLKTHSLAMLTGAIKNTFGFVPGLSKVQCHKKAPHINEFSKILADIFSITKPGLSIMDGIIGMDGDGPAAGRAREFGLILASPDAASLDAVFSHIAGLPYSRNIVLKEVTERNLGCGRLGDIEVVGENLDSVRIRDFRLPKTELIYRLPSWLSGPIARLIGFSPVINEVSCKKCNICKEACPVGALTIDEHISKIDKAKCIKCFCCHEVCPHDAINIKRNLFAKMIWQ
ncbi:MAG: DUF362 domain-containing protein [Candidatus Omnitrophica bacterium]|nr:DUF362 domain-containing protein [Candidatus Omnitrophota bacterium]